jgi:hypothetical protein
MLDVGCSELGAHAGVEVGTLGLAVSTAGGGTGGTPGDGSPILAGWEEMVDG